MSIIFFDYFSYFVYFGVILFFVGNYVGLEKLEVFKRDFLVELGFEKPRNTYLEWAIIQVVLHLGIDLLKYYF